MGCGILYRMVAEQIGLRAMLAMRGTKGGGFEGEIRCGWIDVLYVF
jgi:hypothetical protein